MRGVFRVFLSEALKCLKQQNPYTFNVFLDVTSRFECNTILYCVALRSPITSFLNYNNLKIYNIQNHPEHETESCILPRPLC